MRVRLSENLKWPQEFLREFLCQTCAVDVLSADICLISNVKVQCRESVPSEPGIGPGLWRYAVVSAV